MAILNILIIPVLFLVTAVVLFVKGRRRGLAYGLGFFALTIAIGLWAIMQSRSSTAGIGVLFLPFAGVLAGALAWAFRQLKGADGAALRGLGWSCLAGACAVIAALLFQGWQSIELNRSRDALQQARLARIEANRRMISALLLENKGREAAVIEKLIEERSTDTEFLFPALANEHVSAETLDRFARDDDLGVTLTVIRNPNCRADTLVRIYRTHSYPDYFFQALAAHPNTPASILREMYEKNPRTINGLDIWFAKNPATPPDILLVLAASRDINVIQGLLQNPKLDCNMLGRIDNAIKHSSRPDDRYSASRLPELKISLCGSSLRQDGPTPTAPTKQKESP